MKKIIPFKKEMLFNTNVSEITSISLEHDLKVKSSNLISGNFFINGEYKMSDSSTNTEIFNFELPCDINLDDRYIIDNTQVDIDDFYYEIINSNILQVNIDVLIDKLEEKIIEPIMNEVEIKTTTLDELEKDLVREDNMNELLEKDIVEEMQKPDEIVEGLKEERCIEEEDSVNSLFNNFSDDSETYKTYKICIIREGDTVDSIMQKYSITQEQLEQYNDLKEINLGDKLIIPDLINEKD